MNNIKELAKKLCDKSGCHHKCKEIDECVAMEEAELLISQDNSNISWFKSNKVVIANSATTIETHKYFSPEEVHKMTPKEVRENYDLIMESMKRW